MGQEKVLDEVVADFREIKLVDYAMPYHYVIALLTLMHAAGWRDMDYSTLVVESGVGLSFGYIRNHCVAMYSLQEGAHDRIAGATGFQLEWHVYADPEEAWAWVKETIDQGQPVAAEYSEFHVVAGYRGGEEPEDRQWYVLANEPTSAWDGDWLTWKQVNELREACPWSNFGGRYVGQVSKWEPAETAQHVMEWIVEWSDRHPGRNKELYAGSLFGFEAIEAYASDIGDMAKTLEKDFVFGNNACHAITPQWTTRRYIAAYLEERSALFEDPARSHILGASARYRDADASWTLFDELLGQRYVHKYGGDQKVGWADPERRAKASAGIYAALGHEKAAVAALRAALSAIANP